MLRATTRRSVAARIAVRGLDADIGARQVPEHRCITDLQQTLPTPPFVPDDSPATRMPVNSQER